MSGHNATFYFQSNRKRGRSGEGEEQRPPGRQESFSTTALMGRLAALDEQMGALLRGEGRASGVLIEPLELLQGEIGGLTIALKELAHLREGQERAQREIGLIREELQELGDMHDLLRELRQMREGFDRIVEGQDALQAETARVADLIDRMGRGTAPLLLTATSTGTMVGGSASLSGPAAGGPTLPAPGLPRPAQLPKESPVPKLLHPGDITIQPVRPRIQLGESEPTGPESVLRLDAE